MLSIFDKVVVVGRCKKVVIKPDCQRVDSNRIEFFPVCDFSGYGCFIGLLRAFWQCRKTVGLADRYWLRAPGFVASMVGFWLRRAKIPYYIRLVGDLAEVAETKTMWMPKLISKVIISYVQRRFKKEVASSGGVLASTKYTLQKRYPSKIPENDFFATTLSLSQAIFKNVSRNFNDNVFRIIIVGVLLKYKGHDYLLKALAKIQDQRKWSLLAVGQGPELKNLEQLANEAGIGDRVCFCGRIDWGPKLFEKLDEAHLFVLSSLTEGMPRVVIEAMARALPVIATNVGGVHEIIEPEFLVPVKKAEFLSEKIASLWGNPRELERVSKRNFEKAQEFSLSRTRLLRQAWFRWMKECGDKPEEKRWPEFAVKILPREELARLNL
ncbi:D-inositol-3-phosphate glycosyltransferase [subsurface metagenome]